MSTSPQPVSPEPTPELLVYLFPGTFAVPVVEDLDVSFELDPEDAAELGLDDDDVTGVGGADPAEDGPPPRSRWRPLAVTMLAVAFSTLQQSGNLGLEVRTSRRWFRSTSEVTLRLGPAEGLPAGIASDLYGRAGAQPTASAAVRAWLERDRPNPFADVVERVAADGVRSGYLAAESSSVPSGTAAAALLPHATEVAARFRHFREAEPELFRVLWSEITTALESRMEQVAGA